MANLHILPQAYRCEFRKLQASDLPLIPAEERESAVVGESNFCPNCGEFASNSVVEFVLMNQVFCKARLPEFPPSEFPGDETVWSSRLGSWAVNREGVA